MNDLAIAEPSPIAPPSTVIDTDTPADPSGGGIPRTLEPEAKPEKAPSLREVVSDAVKKDADAKDDAPDEGKAEKGPEKPAANANAPDAKDAEKGPERAPDGKFAAKQAENGELKPDADTKAEAKPNGHIEPPAKFLPDAKETWRNTPRPVQRDVDNLMREHEAELTRHREAAERYEPIRHYDEVARQHGRAGVHESLAEVAQLEDMMGKNPLAALNQILMRAGPRKADGQPVSLFEFASAIVQMGPQGYQQAVARTQQDNQQRGPDPQVEALKTEIAKLREEQVSASVVEPFKRDHPRFDELQDDIAFFLQSGKIPTSLSPPDRLAAAYDMAARINPASHDAAPAADADPEPGDRAAPDLSGSKSIKSAPGAVSPDMEPERGGSISELLRDEMKRAKRS